MEWFLDHAWLVPLIPALSFVVIILFGKRMPKKGSEVGIASIGAVFVLSLGAAAGWISRVNEAEGGGHSALGALRAFGKGLGFPGASEHADLTVLPVTHSMTWFQNGGLKLGVGIQIDGLAVMMMVVVTLISLLVHLYSTEYMRDDRRYTHYYAALSLFSASMLFLVVSDNTLQLLVGWELVGLCSFMLIGHWWEEKPNSDAALKAFLTTRTGDIGLLCGVIMTYFVVERVTGTGSFNILAVNEAAMKIGTTGADNTLLMWCALGLLLGIIGKSGQFPLHTWLPDAMAGPTPVSALIHAATMVVAGVYLGARVYPVFFQGLDIGGGGLNAMAVVGAITVVVGASLAFVQSDIKKVLAYSTISQLGYMVMGLGVGAWSAAIFHLFTHAFFKANLFLGAGSVAHSGSHHSFDMKKDMGGMRQFMPKTFLTFMIGTAALIGIPLTAGFFSKDEILATAGATGYTFFKVVGLVGAFMTACYMTRCVYLTFFGEYRGGHAQDHADAHGHDAHAAPAVHGHDAHGHDAHGHDDHHGAHAGPHESPFIILLPLYVLSVLSIVSGYLLAPMMKELTGIEFFEKFLLWVEPKTMAVGGFPELVHPTFKWLDPILATACGLAGITVAYLFYWRKAFGQNLTERNALARSLKSVLVNKYGLDTLYTGWIVGATKGPIARAAYWVNQNVIDAVLKGAGVGAKRSGEVVYRYFDQGTVDGAVNGLAAGTGATGSFLSRNLQTGRLQGYAVMFMAMVVAFAIALWIGAR